MFTYNEDNGLYWFNSNSLETPAEFRLLGILLGLALYNNVFLGLSFPVCVYKKVGCRRSRRRPRLRPRLPPHAFADTRLRRCGPQLMGDATTLEDLKEVDPELARGLQQLLEYDGEDYEELFDRTFAVEYEVYGEKKVHELCEGGKDISLTRENRQRFVQLYVE